MSSSKIIKHELKITPQTKIDEMITEYPQLVETLMFDYGLHCVNCIFSGFDTLEAGASLHGIEGKDLEDMIDHLNAVVEEGNN